MFAKLFYLFLISFLNFAMETRDYMSGYQIIVRGKVQGVGFRFSAMEAAYKYSVHGFVKNQGSDSVYIRVVCKCKTDTIH